MDQSPAGLMRQSTLGHYMYLSGQLSRRKTNVNAVFTMEPHRDGVVFCSRVEDALENQKFIVVQSTSSACEIMDGCRMLLNSKLDVFHAETLDFEASDCKFCVQNYCIVSAHNSMAQREVGLGVRHCVGHVSVLLIMYFFYCTINYTTKFLKNHYFHIKFTISWIEAI